MRTEARAPVLGAMAFATVLVAGGGATISAQAPQDIEAIRAAALDYGQGWYEGDAGRMERALHPELAKRMIFTDPRTGASRLNQQGALTLIRNTERGGGRGAPVEDRSSTVSILDVFESAAVVKVEGPEWVDYLQMARWDGQWVIVNVLWELRPETRDRMLGGS